MYIFQSCIMELKPSLHFKVLLHICPLTFKTEVLYLVINLGSLKHLLLWLVRHQLSLLCQVFTACYVTKAMLIHFINGKCHIRKLMRSDNYRCISCELLNIDALGGGHTHTYTNLFNKSNFKKPGTCLV